MVGKKDQEGKNEFVMGSKEKKKSEKGRKTEEKINS